MYQHNQSFGDRFDFYGRHAPAIYSLSQKLDLPVDDILSAVQEVGLNPDEIEEYLRDRYNRC